MGIDHIIILLTVLTAIPAALGTTDSNGKVNYRGFIAILLALGLGIGSYFKYLEDEKEKKQKDDQILQLNTSLETAKSELTKIDTNIMTEKRRLYPAFTMNLGKFDSKLIPVPLVKGMSIKIMNQNSDNSLFFSYNNGKEKHIQDTDIEFPIREEVSSLGCSFCNKSDMICSVTYEIWGTLEMQMQSAQMQGITDENDSPVEETEDEPQPEKVESTKVIPSPSKTLNNTESAEKYFVSIGCYGSQNKEQVLRQIFKLEKSDVVRVIKTGKCFRYLVGTGNDSFEEAQIRCDYIRRNNPDCFVMSIIYANGAITGWREFDEN